MMRGFATFYGKHRIIAAQSGATSYLLSKCIISPQGDASFNSPSGLEKHRKLCYNKPRKAVD